MKVENKLAATIVGSPGRQDHKVVSHEFLWGGESQA